MKAMMKKIRNQINGLLLLDKPLGLSSNRAIQRVKWILNAEKVGHTGTLDPLATGLLPVCLGEAQLSAYSITAEQYSAIKFGNPVHLDELPVNSTLEEEVRIYAGEHFLGVATITQRYERLWLAPKRIISGLAVFDPWIEKNL